MMFAGVDPYAEVSISLVSTHPFSVNADADRVVLIIATCTVILDEKDLCETLGVHCLIWRAGRFLNKVLILWSTSCKCGRSFGLTMSQNRYYGSEKKDSKSKHPFSQPLHEVSAQNISR